MGGSCRSDRKDVKSIYNVIHKPEGRRPLERPRHKCEGNIKIRFKNRV